MKLSRLIVIALPLMAAGPGWAQAPGITGILPAGGRVGSTVHVTLSGSNLAGASAVLVSGSGVAAQIDKTTDAAALSLTLTLDARAGLGPHELRVITPKGVSDAGRVWVDPAGYPELVEKEPNDQRPQAQLVEKLPATVNGRIDKGEDVDIYAFNAGTGETWTFALNAAGFDSDLDGFMSLRDERGRDIHSVTDNFGRDPVLSHTFQTAGRYYLRVRDTLYRGGPGYTYRLTLGRLPYVRRWSPLGGQPGSTVTVTLQGTDLGSVSTTSVPIPAGTADPVCFAASTPLGPTNVLELHPSSLPVAFEHEPDDDAKSAFHAPALPVMVDGRIDKTGDRDVIAFNGAEKQPVLLDVLARRLGSRLDSVLRVTDAAGKELATNDDAVGKDSRLTFTPPAAGVYFAEVRSLSTRGGDGYFYRLRIGPPPAADFRLSVTPDNPTLPAGGAVPVTVTAAREGYPGEIALRVEGLPAGATASPATLRAGQNTAVFTLSAPVGAAPAHGQLRITGTAKIGEQTVERVAVGQEKYQPPQTQPEQARSRDTELLIAAVGPAPPYTIAVTAPTLEVKAGAKVELTVKITRTAPFKDNVAVTLLGLPANVTASALTVNGNQTEGKVTLTAAGNAPVGPASIVVQGNGKNVLGAAPALALNVLPK